MVCTVEKRTTSVCLCDHGKDWLDPLLDLSLIPSTHLRKCVCTHNKVSDRMRTARPDDGVVDPYQGAVRWDQNFKDIVSVLHLPVGFLNRCWDMRHPWNWFPFQTYFDPPLASSQHRDTTDCRGDCSDMCTEWFFQITSRDGNLLR
jgi:hypothetical protein